MAYANTPDYVCAEPGCNASFPSTYAYAEIKAHKDGWFSQWNGDRWCPEHLPDWLEEWRANKAKGK